MHRTIVFVLTTLAVGLLLTVNVQAAPVGTQAFADIGTPTANTGNINTATTFSIGDLVSTTANSGVLAGMPTQVFGSVTFNTTVPGSLVFGDSAFGGFTSTLITEASNVPGAVAIYVLGEWTPGSYGGVTGGPYESSFTISFTQTPPSSGSISDSATFAVPPAPAPGVPEPSGIVLALTSLVICGIAYRFRGRRSSANAAA